MDLSSKVLAIYYLMLTLGILLLMLIVGFILNKILKKHMKDEDNYLNDRED